MKGENMNKKQLVCLWVGIITICGLGGMGLYVEHFAYMGYKGFFARAFFVALVSAGLIITFADKKNKKPKDKF
jgi:hypothetical protein